MAQAAVHRVQHMSVRISQILDPSRPRAPRISKIALVGITGIAGICLIAVLQSPTLIAFQGNLVGTAAKPALSGVEGAVLTARINGKATQTGSVFPVVMREPVSSSPRFIPRTRKTNIAAAHAKPRDVVIPANLTRHPEQPKVLSAGLTRHPRTAIPVESILLVMPDARFDASGQVVWTWSVWRLTVFHPVQAPVEGLIPNSI